MNDNLINLLKISLIYPIGFITLFLLSNYKDKLPNIEFIKYANSSNFNNTKKKILAYRKLQISESTKHIIFVLLIILLNVYLVLKVLINDLVKYSSNPFICEINNEYQKELKNSNTNDFDTEIKKLKEECNNSNLNYSSKYGRCYNCSNKQDNTSIEKYKCQYRNRNTQAITRFTSDDTCKIYKEEPDSSLDKDSVVYLIRNFFVLFLICFVINLLLHFDIKNGLTFFKKYMIYNISIVVYLILVLIVAIYNSGEKDFEVNNLIYSILGILLMVIFQSFIKYILYRSP